MTQIERLEKSAGMTNPWSLSNPWFHPTPITVNQVSGEEAIGATILNDAKPLEGDRYRFHQNNISFTAERPGNILNAMIHNIAELMNPNQN